jgi:hypothetical protein
MKPLAQAILRLERRISRDKDSVDSLADPHREGSYWLGHPTTVRRASNSLFMAARESVKLRSQAREQDGGRAALVHHQLEVYRLSGLDLHALRLITRAEQSVRSLWYVELDKARAISSSRSYDAPISRIQNRHLMPT